jgi:hypothetical protein
MAGREMHGIARFALRAKSNQGGIETASRDSRASPLQQLGQNRTKVGLKPKSPLRMRKSLRLHWQNRTKVGLKRSLQRFATTSQFTPGAKSNQGGIETILRRLRIAARKHEFWQNRTKVGLKLGHACTSLQRLFCNRAKSNQGGIETFLQLVQHCCV